MTDIENIHSKWKEVYKRSCSTGFLGTLKDGLIKSEYVEGWKTYLMVNKDKAFGQGDTERIITRPTTQQNNFQLNKSTPFNNNAQSGISANYKGQYPIAGFNKAIYLQQQQHPQQQHNNTVYRRASQLGGPLAISKLYIPPHKRINNFIINYNITPTSNLHNTHSTPSLSKNNLNILPYSNTLNNTLHHV
eukprot:GHVR01058082.1.p1 GENE.GHVR01058082.1~~GHVR01058082.1.p1  ORF type:complete len:190 (-),score=27.25 GHVR01058082.1:180-749(-)